MTTIFSESVEDMYTLLYSAKFLLLKNIFNTFKDDKTNTIVKQVTKEVELSKAPRVVPRSLSEVVVSVSKVLA